MVNQNIAPCGINCKLCIAYQAYKYDLKKKGFHKGYCPGCIARGKNCTHIGKWCELLAKGLVRFCYECKDFPCKRLKALDKRYLTKYRQSPIESLKLIQEKGLEIFSKQQLEKWSCPNCRSEICSQNGLCLNCNLKVLQQNKKYHWGE